jgi:TRAP-type mannitol/chloroaromatic compound transport system substrate-binding protein
MRLKALVALTCASIVALPATASFAQKRVKWKMQSAFGSSLPHLGTSGPRFTKNVEEATDGKFQIKFHEPGALVPALECFDAAAKGSVDACWTTPGYHAGKFPAVSFFTAVPFGPGFGEFVAWKKFGGGDKIRNDLYAKHGVIAFDNFCIGPETSGWFKKNQRRR